VVHEDVRVNLKLDKIGSWRCQEQGVYTEANPGSV
jgi:hypothetical protein